MLVVFAAHGAAKEPLQQHGGEVDHLRLLVRSFVQSFIWFELVVCLVLVCSFVHSFVVHSFICGWLVHFLLVGWLVL